jgi:hypothetical protein
MENVIQSSKDKNRAQFPFTSSIVDELREAGFGDVTVAFAEENGKRIGKPLPEGVQPVLKWRGNDDQGNELGMGNRTAARNEAGAVKARRQGKR